MYGSYKDSPEKKSKREEAVKGIEDFFSGKTPRKTPEQAKADREAWKQKSMADVKARNDKIKADALERDRADLPNLEKRHAKLSATHTKGQNWMYADREQNLSDEERKARDVSSELSSLGNRISAVKRNTSSYAKGGKISLKDCGTSTASKGKNNSCW
jgi:hypothetical protein